MKESDNMTIEKPQKHPGGVPSKYRPEFHPADFIKRRENGESMYMIARAWDIYSGTIMDWVHNKKFPEFATAYKKGADACRSFYDKIEKNQTLNPQKNWNHVNQIQLRKRLCQPTGHGGYSKADLPTKVRMVDEWREAGELDENQYKIYMEVLKVQADIYKTLEILPRLEAIEERMGIKNK